MKRVAVLISNAGTGSNLQAIIDAIVSDKLQMKLSVVISDKEDAYGLVRARKAKIPTHIYDSKKEKLIKTLTKNFPSDYIVLTGWKKIVPDDFIEAFPQSILNIHPGLIPDAIDAIVKNPDGTEALWNRGKFTDGAIQEFFNQKATYAGSSVHFLSNEFDFGKVLARDFEKIRKNDNPETLYARLKKKENKMVVEALKKLSS